MKSKVLFAATAAGAFALFSAAAGCSEKTEKAAEQTAQGVAQDAQNHTQAAGQAVENTGEAVAKGTENAVEATGQAAQKAAQATERGVENVAAGAGKVVASGAKELNDASQVMTLTPKVKNALLTDEKIAAHTLDVDTSGEKDTITIKGGPVPKALKDRITKVAKQAVGNAKIKINNQVTTK